jgi:hypothetical protein
MTPKLLVKNILPHGLVNHFTQKNNAIPSSDEPLLYNSHGQRIKTIFLRSDIARHWPYGFVTGQFPRYTFWDRNNYGLKNHTYVHDKILRPVGKPVKKFALFIESESIVPKDYTIFNSHAGLENDFDLIFTFSDKLLNLYKNSVFIPAGGVYYGTLTHGGSINSEQYKQKTRNISIIASAKIETKLHRFRIELSRYYKKHGNVDTFGTFDGEKWAKITDYLDNYRYTIVIENDMSSYYFTEKILNCFASMTIPIYIGALKIGNFFNLDGIIQVHKPDVEYIDKLLSSCNEKDYLSRLPAIVDNFNRVKYFLCIEDYIYAHYKEYFS